MRFRQVISAIIATALVMMPARDNPRASIWNEPSKPDIDVGISERLGLDLAKDAVFKTEDGREIKILDALGRPTVIAFVYHKCRDVCPLLLTGATEVMSKIPESPGRDYNFIAVSFDETDTPEAALKAKENYITALGRPVEGAGFGFLTGDNANIKKLADSAGFGFKRVKDGFAHTAALVVVSPSGKIARYLYGVSFLPFDLRMALTEAAEGRTGSTARKALLYCYSYDKEGKRYVFNILKVTGTITLAFAAGFFAYLVVSSRKNKGGHDA